MSWSTDMWDQFDAVSKHTAKGIDFLDKLGQFVKDRCVVELDYASNLKKLVKAYDSTTNQQSINKKHKNNTNNINNNNDSVEAKTTDFTYCKAFTLMLKELSQIAGQHEIVAENMSNQIVKEISIINKELREERKKNLHESIKYNSLLTNNLTQLDKTKQKYEKTFKDSEKAHDNYQKADKDLNLSRADLEKAKTNALNKERACEDSKTSYARQLQITNQAQRKHYSELMPKIFQQLQDLDSRRIESTRNFIKLSAIIQKNVIPTIDKCLDGIQEASNIIDCHNDAQLVSDRYKTGAKPPDDIQFEDLSDVNINKTNSLASTLPSKSDYFRHTFTARGFKKRTILANFFGINNKNEFSDLPPNQKRKQLQIKIEQLSSQIQQANHEKDGLLTMRQAYEENGAFGDPKTIESQLKETELKLMKLNNELTKHVVILRELDNTDKCGNSICDNNDTISNSPSLNPSIISQNDYCKSSPHSTSKKLSQSSSKSDVNITDATRSSATNNRASNSFADSCSDTMSHSDKIDCPDGVNINNDENHTSNDSCDVLAVDLPSLADARALYLFENGPLGSISMKENELFEVIEFDHGDGWTRVRRKDFDPKSDNCIGFVPTSYVQIDT